MRRKLILLFGLFLTGVLAVEASPQVENTGKAVRSEKGKPLVALLKPGQTELLVEKDQAPPHYVEPPPGMSQLEWMASIAPVVAVIRVDAYEVSPSDEKLKPLARRGKALSEAGISISNASARIRAAHKQ